MSAVAVILIGRNEGVRLAAALESLADHQGPVVYVDSGSTDDSVARARAAGVRVVELDRSSPFSAARARNAGFAALEEAGETGEFVQFIDGDCALVPGWLEAGAEALAADPALGLVTGWRAEIAPGASLYNAQCDLEWHRPAGEIKTCGGDMMLRARAFRETGGFDPTVIAAEDDDFCLRLGALGWKLRRLPLPMTRHDAAMTRFSQWWRRAERSGHGFAQVSAAHPQHFRAERRRVLLFGALLPLLMLAGLASGQVWLFWLGLAAYGLSYLRGLFGLRRQGLPIGGAAMQALLLSLSKFPNMIGMIRYHLRRLRGVKMRLIEYK